MHVLDDLQRSSSFLRDPAHEITLHSSVSSREAGVIETGTLPSRDGAWPGGATLGSAPETGRKTSRTS